MNSLKDMIVGLTNMRFIRPLLGDLSDLNFQNLETNFKNNKAQAILVLEVRGGIDKKPQGKGHRIDTMPICNQIIKFGWISFPIYYCDDDEAYVKKVLNQSLIKGVIVRINPSNVPGVTNQKWRKLLTSFQQKKMIMSPPTIMAKMGSKDSLMNIINLQSGMKDTKAYYTIQEWNQKFMKNLAQNPKAVRVIKQNRGSCGEGIWIVKVKDPSKKINQDSVLNLIQAVDNHTQEQTIKSFTKFCQKYLQGEDGLLVDQKFLPRIVEGEIRVNMISDEIVSLVHKVPKKGGISATLDSGAVYTSYSPNDEKFKGLSIQLKKDLPKMKGCFNMEHIPFPLIWTIDYIYDQKTSEGLDTYRIGEINCTCVGITSQLQKLAPKVAKAAIRCCTQSQ